MGGEGVDGGIRHGEASNQFRCVPSGQGKEKERGEANQCQTGTHDAALHGVIVAAVVVAGDGGNAHTGAQGGTANA